MKIILSNSTMEFRKELPYKQFSGSDNQYANTYWNMVILTNNNNFEFNGHIILKFYVTTQNIGTWQLFNGETFMGLFQGSPIATKFEGTLVTADYGTFNIQIIGDIENFQLALMEVARQAGGDTTVTVTDLADKINYSQV